MPPLQQYYIAVGITNTSNINTIAATNIIIITNNIKRCFQISECTNTLTPSFCFLRMLFWQSLVLYHCFSHTLFLSSSYKWTNGRPKDWHRDVITERINCLSNVMSVSQSHFFLSFTLSHLTWPKSSVMCRPSTT